MARVTVEDCLAHVDNRFQLVLLASKRARQLAMGSEPFLEWENDKPSVMALREIAEGHIGPELLEQRSNEFAERFESETAVDIAGLGLPSLESVSPRANESGEE